MNRAVLLERWSGLYSNQTDAEKALEPAVAELGVPYRTQHPVWSLCVFPDFVLLRQKVIFEVDDPGHSRPAKRKADAERTARLEKAGYRVFRCTNDEALADPRGAVARMLRQAGLESLIPQPKETP